LFRTLAGGKRMIGLAAVERVEEVRPEQVAFTGGRCRVTLGDQILPLEGCDAPPSQPIKVLRVTDGACDIGYAAAEIIDIAAIPAGLSRAAESGEVAGVVLIGGEQIELIDLHWLFARAFAAEAAAPLRPACLLAGSDPFLETILRPLVEAAGYRALRPGEAGAEAAAIVISCAEEERGAGEISASARLLRIRASREPLGAGDDSIHRYDRPAILGALAGAAGAAAPKRRRKG
jgi:two-component system chemotaxis sensor kinase CheA